MKKTMVFGLPILMILLSAIIAASSASPHESTVAREYAAAVQISNRSDVKIAGVSIAYGSEKTVQLKARVDTEVEIEYLQNGGVLHYVLRNLARA